jgi:transposase
MILYAKFGQHQPLNRQSKSFAREGIELDVSTLADWVGARIASLSPLIEAVRRHVLAVARLHGDDTTVPVLAKGKTVTGRVWVYIRDDRPFAGPDPPAALFCYSRNRSGEHPRRHLARWAGILEADAYTGFGELYEAQRSPRPIAETACWAHGRRKFFELADLHKAPRAVEAVRCIDQIFAIEAEINGAALEKRIAARQQRIKPLVDDLEAWMRAERHPAVVLCRARQSDRLYAQSLARLWPLSRRWPHLPQQPCRRAGLARHRPRPQKLVVRRLRPWR